jgi:hypothetical protein
VLRSEHTAQEFVKIDEWTRPAGISRYGNIGPKIDWATSPATYRGTIRKSPDTGPGSVDGGVPVFCHWSLRPRFAFNHAATTEVTSRIPRTLSAALGDDFRDVRAVEFSPLVLRTIGHDFRRTGNALSAPDALLATFVPVNGSRDENEAGAKSWNATARKVGTGRTGPNCKSRSRAGSFRYGGSDGAASAARSFDLIGSQPSPAWVSAIPSIAVYWTNIGLPSCPGGG